MARGVLFRVGRMRSRLRQPKDRSSGEGIIPAVGLAVPDSDLSLQILPASKCGGQRNGLGR